MQKDSGNKQVVITLIVLIATTLLIVGVVGFKNSNKEAQNTTETSVAKNHTMSQPDITSAETAVYKDGTYTATGHYVSPGGEQALKVSVTLKNGVISDTSAQPDNTSPESREYQGKFIAHYKTLVIGKEPGEVNLSRVSGSSLTSGGFKDALEQIENQAKS